MRRFQRPSAATIIVALVAALLASGGTATAARLISGKDIRNNSITGKDIRTRSIKLSDFGFYNGDGVADVFEVNGADVSLQPGQTTFDALGGGNFAVRCPANTTVIGTGFGGPIAGDIGFVQKFGNTVGGFMVNRSSIVLDVSLQAICAYGGDNSPVAAAASLRESPEAEFRRMEREYQRRYG